MKTQLDRITLTIFAALGLPLGCAPGSIGMTGSESETTGDGDGDPTGDGDGDGDATTGDGDGDLTTGDGDGDPTTGDGDGDPEPFVCLDPQPIMQAGTEIPSGFVMCEGGFIHRAEAVECVNPTVIDDPTCAEFPGSCGTGADCVDKPYGGCAQSPFEGCACSYGCATDADCEDGYVCACAGVIGDAPTCIPSGCETDAACGEGLCGLSQYEGCCGDSYQVGCADPNEACHVDADCGVGPCDAQTRIDYQCSLSDGGWICSEPGWCGCDCGRPFLVDGEARVAAAVSRSDWGCSCAPATDTLDPATRRALADAWTEIGQFEHASIASFARFAAQLLALGAPPRLLADTHAAMHDEIVHAKLAFGLASAYAGASIGPGPLAIVAALGHVDPTAIVEGLIVEACVGETLAAIEAHEAAAHARDPNVAEILRTIADDELRHAQLGWRALRWILDQGDASLRRFAIHTLDVAIAAVANEATTRAHVGLDRHGILGQARRAEVRRAALAQVIRPAAAALNRDRTPTAQLAPSA